MDFSCPEEECNYDGAGPYVLKLPKEACMDEHNVATPFCPHCGQALKKMDLCPEPFES